MTHTRPMADDEGDFGLEEPAPFVACPSCDSADVRVRLWSSHDGAYEDEQFRCVACSHRWWVDGIDA